MNTRQFLRCTTLFALGACALVQVDAQTPPPQPPTTPFVRWADLRIAPDQLAAFQVAAKAHAEAALRLEPGVLALHVLAEKDQPTQVRVFEMYADEAAYRAHLKTAHFLHFRASTAEMVTSRQLHDAVPIRLGAKQALPVQALVRVAELRIDPAQRAAYIAAVSEEIDDSIRLEPGVAALYAVALADNPSTLRFFEVYASEAAYQSHLSSAHFKRYAERVQGMLTDRTLLEMRAIALAHRAPQ